MKILSFYKVKSLSIKTKWATWELQFLYKESMFLNVKALENSFNL